MEVRPARDAIGAIKVEMDAVSAMDIADGLTKRREPAIHRGLRGIVGREDDIGPVGSGEFGEDRSGLVAWPHFPAQLGRSHRFGLALEIDKPTRKPSRWHRIGRPPYRCVDAAISGRLVPANGDADVGDAAGVRLSDE